MTQAGGMSPIVRTVSRWMRGLLLLYGIQVVLYGHLSPGGGFCGGVLIAAAFALVLLAEGRESPLCVRALQAAERLDGLGALALLAVAAAGLWLGGSFFENVIETPASRRFALPSSGTILLGNVAIGLKVASGLTLGIAALAVARRPGDAAGGEGRP